MDTKDIVLGASILLLMSMAGFYLASSSDEREPVDNGAFTQNFTATGDEEIVTASFDNRSLNLMLESRTDARFYLDLDTDGSFDREIENSGNGTVEKNTELVKLRNRTYRLYLETQDDAESEDDAYLRLYRAVRQ